VLLFSLDLGRSRVVLGRGEWSLFLNPERLGYDEKEENELKDGETEDEPKEAPPGRRVLCTSKSKSAEMNLCLSRGEITLPIPYRAQIRERTRRNSR